MLFLESLSLSVASYFFIPFFITDVVSQNFYFTPWYIVGLGAICFGGFGMVYSLFSFGEKKSLKEKLNILWKVLVIYIGLRIFLALFFGGLGLILVQNLNDLDSVKTWIDRGLQLALGPINAFLLLYFVKLLHDTPWKQIWDNILPVTVVFYAMELLLFLLQIIGASYGALAIQAILSAGMVTLVIIFTFYLWDQKTNTCELA